MDPIFLGHVLIFSLSAVICLSCIPLLNTIEHSDTRMGLVWLLISVGIWSIGYVGYLVGPTTGSKHAFYILGFVFALVAVGAWLYFCAAYTGRPPRRVPYKPVVVVVFMGLIGLKITNPLHERFFTIESTTEPFLHLGIDYQLLYWILLGLSYVIVAIGFFMLLERFYQTGTDARPLIVLLVVTGIPAVGTIFSEQFHPLLPLMYEPPGVALFAVGTLLVYRRRFDAIRLTGGSDEPAIFLDRSQCIRDYNRAAEQIFPSLADSIGQSIESILPRFAEIHSDQIPVSVEYDGRMRYYQLSTTPFTSGEVTTGALVTITDITDAMVYRKRLEAKTEQLETKTEQLEALNRVVRHDIRNDMSVVYGWADALRNHVDEDGATALEHVLVKSQHVISITDAARDFVDSLSGDQLPNLKSIRVDQLLETEVMAVQASYPNAQVRFTSGLPPVSVRANEMLASVFRNILGNAIRHNDSATPVVSITCVTGSDFVQIQVADNGPGIPDARKEQILGKGDKGLDSPGSGIGLYLVHSLTDQFGGRVWVEDNDPNGAIFVVELQKV